MSKSKILLKITGSIAAYKSAYLISKLMQNNYEVKVVATPSALEFIGKATLEGLTGNVVYTDSFQEGEMMSHINLVKWADITVVAPATANTINKLASGIGDNILSALFLAHDWSKPYLIAPAMNTAMYNHPATQGSLKKLKEWGAEILPTDTGYLACGDEGEGKLLDPDKIYEQINEIINKKNPGNSNSLNVLITSGGTSESIDGIRYLSNLSTGNTGTSIANHFINKGYNVTYLHSVDAKLPNGVFKDIQFTDFKNLNDKLKDILNTETYDVVFHLAAVSDFSLSGITIGDEKLKFPLEEKLSSKAEEISLHLKSNFKILDKIKEYSGNERLCLVSFKFTNEKSEENKKEKVLKQLNNSKSDFVVLNDFGDREDNVQKNFKIFDDNGKITNVQTVNELSEKLESLINEKMKTKEI